MEYIRFFLGNKRLISFGFLLTFFSSFGQTFLLSLYVPDLIKEFHLTNSSFGGLYAAATLAGSIILVYVGKFIDNSDLRKYTLYSALILFTACVVLAVSQNIIFVLIGFLGLRLAGQGLLSHISNTSISKHFEESRGKALSITALGYSLGEGIFPIIVGVIIGLAGWRYSMLLNALFVAVILIPFIWVALSNYNTNYPQENKNIDEANNFSRINLIKSENFYLIAVNSVMLPFFVTGLFFYQIVLAESMGWTVEIMSVSFIGFAFGRTLFSLISGKMVDRFSAVKLFPLYLIPFAVGLILLLIADYPYIAMLYLFLTGLSVGLSSTIKTSVVAEIYGTKNLGSVRSVFATLMVISTALGPLLFGYMLDHGFHFSSIISFSLIIVIFVSVITLRLERNYKADLAVNYKGK